MFSHKQFSQGFILFTLFLQSMAITDPFGYTVHVISKLPPNTPYLYVHCKSGDRDLGDQVLASNQDFHWDFDSGFHTLYFCNLSWNGKSKTFDVYSVDWPTSSCPHGVCTWVALPDGIYLADSYPPNGITRQYVW
ncbi:hypothetical protein ACP275_12G044700 [Erythranthe tilingii]